MKTNGREDSGRYGIILGSEVILKVDPQASAALASDDSPAPEPLDARSKVDQSVVLSTARSSERALLALVDGRRTVQDLVRLAGMSDLVVRRHLRALCERGVLVPTNLPSAPSAAAPESPPVEPAAPERSVTRTLSGEPGGDGLSRALTEYLDSGKTAVVQAPASEAITVKASTSGPTPASGPSPAPDPSPSKVVVVGALQDSKIDSKIDSKAGGPSPAVGSQPSEPGSAGAKRSDSPPSGVIAGEWPRRRSNTPSNLKPNVTAFWIPSSSDPAPASSPAGASRSAPPASGSPAAPAVPAAPATPSAPPGPPAPLAAPVSSGPATTMMWPRPAESPVRPIRPVSPPQGNVIVAGSAALPDPDPDPGLSGSAIDAIPASVGASGSRGRGGAIPFRLGEYEVATRIAQGGTGSIYVCRRAGATGTQRLFTLKVVRQHAKQVAQVVQSFRREARVGALLSHPNVQTVVHVGTYHEQPFLILDYVEGIGLAELMASHKRLPPAIVVSILVDVLRGLKAAHDLVDEQGARLGLVHGDVSPQNILVGVDGNARLTDFGSTRFISDARAPETAPVLMGKPAFMSPEQLCADPIDARTDLFSLGVVMWTALTGQTLFAADSYDQIVVNIFRKKIPPPSEFGAPTCFDEISMTALSRASDGRYSSAEEMANALSRVARAEGIVGSPYDVGQWVRREFAETLAERRRRIQVVFGGMGTGGSGSMPIVPAANLEGVAPAAAEKLGATSADGFARLPSRTIQLPTMPRRRSTPRLTALNPTVPSSTGAERWRVVAISAAIAFPFALALAYLVSNPLARRLRAPHPPAPAVMPAGAAQPGSDPAMAPVAPVAPVPPVAPAAAPVAAPQGAVDSPATPGAEVLAPQPTTLPSSVEAPKADTR